MDYAELTYFDGYHFSHIAAWQDHRRLERKRVEAIKALDRRGGRRYH
jgi:hypothetical protein